MSQGWTPAEALPGYDLMSSGVIAFLTGTLDVLDMDHQHVVWQNSNAPGCSCAHSECVNELSKG